MNDLNDVKVVKTAVLGPLFEVDFWNVPLVDEFITGAVFL